LNLNTHYYIKKIYFTHHPRGFQNQWLTPWKILDYFLPTICDIYNLLTVDPKNNKIDKIIEVLKDLKGIASHSVLLRKKIRSKGISQSH